MLARLWFFVSLATQEVFAQEKQAEPKEEVITLEPITVTATPHRGRRAAHRPTGGGATRRKAAAKASSYHRRDARPRARDQCQRLRPRGEPIHHPGLRGLAGAAAGGRYRIHGRLEFKPRPCGQYRSFTGGADQDPQRAATLLYGSGAVGGVVNTVTGRIPTRVPDAPTVDGFFRYDSATNERTGGGKVEAGLGDLAFHLDGLKLRTSDYAISA